MSAPYGLCEWCGEAKIADRAGSRYCGACNDAWAQGRVGELRNRFAGAVGAEPRAEYFGHWEGCVCAICERRRQEAAT